MTFDEAVDYLRRGMRSEIAVSFDSVEQAFDTLRSQLATARSEERERAAKACDEVEADVLCAEPGNTFGAGYESGEKAGARRCASGSTDYGAGPRRNRLIADYADRVVAFFGAGKSDGTRNCCEEFDKRGKPIDARDHEGKPVDWRSK